MLCYALQVGAVYEVAGIEAIPTCYMSFRAVLSCYAVQVGRLHGFAGIDAVLMCYHVLPCFAVLSWHAVLCYASQIGWSCKVAPR